MVCTGLALAAPANIWSHGGTYDSFTQVKAASAVPAQVLVMSRLIEEEAEFEGGTLSFREVRMSQCVRNHQTLNMKVFSCWLGVFFLCKYLHFALRSF